MAVDAPAYPVSLLVRDQDCLVVGGGPVAVRKVGGLLECGARVTVIAPVVADAIRAWDQRSGPPGHLRVETRRYRSPEASHYQLVITATGVPEVDGAVSADARRAGVWVNSADDTANCTFILPAVDRRGPVTVAVSTGGTSPALAGWLRTTVAEAIDSGIGPQIAVLAELLDEARSRIRSSGRSTEAFDWTTLLDRQVLPLVRAGRIDDARTLLRTFSDS